jgi:hypothetical protein
LILARAEYAAPETARPSSIADSPAKTLKGAGFIGGILF